MNTKTKTKNDMPEDIEFIILGAFRYAMGRRSYIVSTTVNFIMNNIDIIPKGFRNLMIDEITMGEQGEFFYQLGDECDKQQWLKLREFLKELDNE